MSEQIIQSKKQVISQMTAILTIMSEAAYAAHNKRGMKGTNAKERATNYLYEASIAFPGLAPEIAKYTVIQAYQTLSCFANHAEKKVIIAFRGTGES